MTAVHSFHHRLAIAGVLVVAAGQAIYAAVAIPAGDPQAPLFVPGALIVLGVAAALRRTPKALWIPVVAGPPALAIFAIDSFRLLHPDSFIDFWPSVLVVAGTATACGASAAALMERRKGTERPATRLERRAVGFGAIVLVALAAVSAVLTFTSRPTVTLPGGIEAVLVRTAKDRWVPEGVSVPAQGAVLLVRNADWFAHTFTAPELGIDVYLGPRSERTIEIGEGAVGSYRLECVVTGHEAMVGTVRVV